MLFINTKHMHSSPKPTALGRIIGIISEISGGDFWKLAHGQPLGVSRYDVRVAPFFAFA